MRELGNIGEAVGSDQPQYEQMFYDSLIDIVSLNDRVLYPLASTWDSEWSTLDSLNVRTDINQWTLKQLDNSVY